MLLAMTLGQSQLELQMPRQWCNFGPKANGLSGSDFRLMDRVWRQIVGSKPGSGCSVFMSAAAQMRHASSFRKNFQCATSARASPAAARKAERLSVCLRVFGESQAHLTACSLAEPPFAAG